jgi:hypothetical protein
VKGRVCLYPAETAPSGGSLLTAGSFRDLDALGIIPKNGLRLEFYSDDADQQNNPAHLCFEGVLYYDSGDAAWCANVDESTFRWVPVHAG